MPFFVLGVLILIYGIIQVAKARHHQIDDSESGAVGLVVAGIILIVLYGIFYRALAFVTQ